MKLYVTMNIYMYLQHSANVFVHLLFVVQYQVGDLENGVNVGNWLCTDPSPHREQ